MTGGGTVLRTDNPPTIAHERHAWRVIGSQKRRTATGSASDHIPPRIRRRTSAFQCLRRSHSTRILQLRASTYAPDVGSQVDDDTAHEQATDVVASGVAFENDLRSLSTQPHRNRESWSSP